MTIVDQAFRADVGHSEKLVLVYLAFHASREGYGVWDRDTMEPALGYQKRSMQRLIKNLKDAELLEDLGDWYRIPTDIGPQLEPPAYFVQPGPLGEGDAVTVAGLETDEIIGSLTDVSMQSEARIVHSITRAHHGLQAKLDQFVENIGEIARQPPPDPVKDSTAYRALIDAGIDPDFAYNAVAGEIDKGYSPEPIAAEARPVVAPKLEADPLQRYEDDAPGRLQRYEDDAPGRLQRVADILVGEPAEIDVPTMDAWLALEEAENKFTTRGEVDAFELLYPAIVEAAKRNVGMSIEQFLDPVAIKTNRAPWDLDPAPTAIEDPALEAEIQVMLAAINATGDKRFQMQPRTTEVAPDGRTLIEPIQAYHRRVKRMHDQVQRMKEREQL